MPEGTFWHFDGECRACQQLARNQAKNLDRPSAIIERRARQQTARCGATFDFFLMNLNWRSLVPIYRALSTDPGAGCQSCGHPFDNERDIQIEHFLAPRSLADWARHHARNLRFLCTNCNRTKSAKEPAAWLDDEEGARLANEANQLVTVGQLTLGWD